MRFQWRIGDWIRYNDAFMWIGFGWTFGHREEPLHSVEPVVQGPLFKTDDWTGEHEELLKHAPMRLLSRLHPHARRLGSDGRLFWSRPETTEKVFRDILLRNGCWVENKDERKKLRRQHTKEQRERKANETYEQKQRNRIYGRAPQRKSGARQNLEDGALPVYQVRPPRPVELEEPAKLAELANYAPLCFDELDQDNGAARKWLLGPFHDAEREPADELDTLVAPFLVEIPYRWFRRQR